MRELVTTENGTIQAREIKRPMHLGGARGGLVVKALGYKPEGRGFVTR
jgi:hypothetical protein